MPFQCVGETSRSLSAVREIDARHEVLLRAGVELEHLIFPHVRPEPGPEERLYLPSVYRFSF